MSDIVLAPFAPDQVKLLNEYQRLGAMHPFTCGTHSDTSLVASTDGWTCPHSEGLSPIDVRCDYTQDWAHAFMADPEAIAGMRQQVEWMHGRVVETRQQRIEAACEVMHDAYEKAALGAGWETQKASRKPWADVPEANKVTMRAAVAALLDWLE